MAIRTAHLTLIDLGFDPCPASTASRIGRDVGNLVADVIELKNDYVGLPAVHAGMRAEVLDYFFTNLGASCRDLADESRLLTLMILPVVPRIRFGEAIPTPALQLRLAAPHRWKRLERLHLAALRARSHEGERADLSTADE
jgi:hypothetical protein